MYHILKGPQSMMTLKRRDSRDATNVNGETNAMDYKDIRVD